MSPSQPLATVLKRVSVFDQLDDGALGLLEEQMRLAVFEPGAVLCREGEAGDRMFLIESGEIAVLKQGQVGRPVEMTVLRAGEIAGVMSLFGPAQRSATLQARTAARVWTLDHAAFDKLLERHGTPRRFHCARPGQPFPDHGAQVSDEKTLLGSDDATPHNFMGGSAGNGRRSEWQLGPGRSKPAPIQRGPLDVRSRPS